MDICKTVRVKPWGKDQGDFVEINESDFSTDQHELFSEGSDEDSDGAKKANVAELRAALTEKGIEIPDGAKKAELQALLDEANKPKE